MLRELKGGICEFTVCCVLQTLLYAILCFLKIATCWLYLKKIDFVHIFGE